MKKIYIYVSKVCLCAFSLTWHGHAITFKSWMVDTFYKVIQSCQLPRYGFNFLSCFVQIIICCIQDNVSQHLKKSGQMSISLLSFFLSFGLYVFTLLASVIMPVDIIKDLSF